MGKTFVRGKGKYSLAEKKELGELVEKCKKEYDKEVKAICHQQLQQKDDLVASGIQRLVSTFCESSHCI